MLPFNMDLLDIFDWLPITIKIFHIQSWKNKLFSLNSCFTPTWPEGQNPCPCLVPQLYLQVCSTNYCSPSPGELQVSPAPNIHPTLPTYLVSSFTCLAFSSLNFQPRNYLHFLPSSYCSIITAIIYWAVTMHQAVSYTLYTHSLF